MSHLTVEQRYTISEMKQKGYTQTSIAEVIGKNKSVVSRELRRNCDKGSSKYHYDLAQRKYVKRQAEKPIKVVFTSEVKNYVRAKLEQKYSPEQIRGEAKKNCIFCVSHESIYQFIWEDKRQGGALHKNLRTQGKRYRKRGSKKDKRNYQRPSEYRPTPKRSRIKRKIGRFRAGSPVRLIQSLDKITREQF